MSEHEGVTVLVISGGDVPYRTWMRLTGQTSRRGRNRTRRRVCVRCGGREVDGVPMSVDHIVPQMRLAQYPHIRDDRANRQSLCSDVVEQHERRASNPHAGVATYVSRYGCNGKKGHGPAVDHRGSEEQYVALLRLLAEARLPIEVEWDPHPWRGWSAPNPLAV